MPITYVAFFVGANSSYRLTLGQGVCFYTLCLKESGVPEQEDRPKTHSSSLTLGLKV